MTEHHSLWENVDKDTFFDFLNSRLDTNEFLDFLWEELYTLQFLAQLDPAQFLEPVNPVQYFEQHSLSDFFEKLDPEIFLDFIKHRIDRDDLDDFLKEQESLGNKRKRAKEPVLCNWPDCNKSFTSPCLFKIHEQIHTGEKPYVCEVCNYGFRWITSLYRHKMEANKKPSQCEPCGLSFCRQRHFDSHMRVNHPQEKPYSCDSCPEAFKLPYQLKVHVQIHTSEKTYVCRVCNYGSSKKDNLDRHEAAAANEKPSQCEHCGLIFCTQRQFISHMRVVHPLEKAYSCDSCPEVFSKLRQLNSHKQTHTGKKLHVCQVCSYAFRRKDGLVTHEKAAKKEPLQCEPCGLKFCIQHQFDSHMKADHPQEKPYSCDICREAFKKPHLLKVHKRKHTGSEPLTCKTCGQSFGQPSAFSQHKTLSARINGNPYPCGFCDKVFCIRVQVSAHIKDTHPNEKPYSCDHCHKRFTSSSGEGDHKRHKRCLK